MPETASTTLTLTQIVLALIGSSAVGAILTELLRKFRSKEDKAALAAVASRDHAQGEAAVIGAMATAFTGTTASLREEIERLQEVLNELRSRVVEAEAETRASAAREAVLQQTIIDQKALLETSHADVIRLRAERDAALERVTQQEGEIRQLHAVADAAKRLEARS